MSNVFLGQIITCGFNFAPVGFQFCNGAILPISQYSALFSLLGTQFGGNGTTTFALPDLRGRVPVGTQQGPGLSNYVIGQAGGTESVTLTSAQMPIHTHTTTVSAATAKATLATPAANVVLARAVDTAGTVTPVIYAPAGTATAVALGGVNTATAGGSQPFGNLQPYLAITQVIATSGIYPSRN